MLDLVGNGSLGPVQSDVTIEAVTQRVLKLNATLCAKAMHSADITYLASAVTGGGISVGQLHMQFLALRAEGSTGPREWSHQLATNLQTAGVQLVHEGTELNTHEAMADHILELALAFQERTLPVLQKLQCVT